MPSFAQSLPKLRSARIVDGKSWIVPGQSTTPLPGAHADETRTKGSAVSMTRHADGTRTNRPESDQSASPGLSVRPSSACDLIETAPPFSLHNFQYSVPHVRSSSHRDRLTIRRRLSAMAGQADKLQLLNFELPKRLSFLFFQSKNPKSKIISRQSLLPCQRPPHPRHPPFDISPHRDLQKSTCAMP